MSTKLFVPKEVYGQGCSYRGKLPEVSRIEGGTQISDEELKNLILNGFFEDDESLNQG